jgi:hypothetical protein
VTARAWRVLAAAVALVALLVLVGGIALVASYWHARALAHAYRSPLDTIPDLSAWLPLTTDGLLAGAFAVIYWRRLADLDVPRLAWTGAALAGVSTIAANLATAYPSVTGWIVAGWAPVTFTLVDFLVAILIPPLVKAWRDARDDTPWPLPEPTAVMPGDLMVAAVTPIDRPTTVHTWTAPERDPIRVSPEGFPPRPAHSVVERNVFDDTSPIDNSLTTDPRAVSTLRPEIHPGDPIPATDDEAVQRLQGEIDSGKLPGLPSARSLRNRWGFNSAKAKRIIERLEERAS